MSDAAALNFIAAQQGTQDPVQIPGKPQVWKVGGTSYLAYFIPGTNTPLVWEAADDQLDAFFQGSVPAPSRTMNDAEFKALSPWKAGLAAELRNPADDPWTQFFSDFSEAAELRPWLKEPDMLATLATAYLEGHPPSQDELSKTDWWNTHKAEERAWLEESVTMGDREMTGRINKAQIEVAEQLRAAGMADPSDELTRFIATRRLTGSWSDVYVATQVRKLADPYAPGALDGNLAAFLSPVGDVYEYPTYAKSDSPERLVTDLFKKHGVSLTQGSTEKPKDRIARIAKEIQGGRTLESVEASIKRLSGQNPDVEARVRGIFEDFGAPIAMPDESEDERIGRIADEIRAGRTFGSVIDSVRRLGRIENPGRDVTRQGEDQVQALAAQWLGPSMGTMTGERMQEWAGRIRNDPDAEIELVELLKQQRLAMFPTYTNENLTYEDIVSPVRNMATNVWGRPMTDETMLIDLANTGDYSEMQRRLRRTGLDQNVEKVVRDALGTIGESSMGEQIVRSQV